MFGADAFRGLVPGLIVLGIAIGFVLFVVLPWGFRLVVEFLT